MPGNCGNCGKAEARSKCSRCSTAFYCDRECQKAAWPSHKRSCGGGCKSAKTTGVDEGKIKDLAGKDATVMKELMATIVGSLKASGLPRDADEWSADRLEVLMDCALLPVVSHLMSPSHLDAPTISEARGLRGSCSCARARRFAWSARLSAAVRCSRRVVISRSQPWQTHGERVSSDQNTLTRAPQTFFDTVAQQNLTPKTLTANT